TVSYQPLVPVGVGELTAIVGGVVSIFTVKLSVELLPAASVQVVEADWTPWLLNVTEFVVHVDPPLNVAVDVNVTVTRTVASHPLVPVGVGELTAIVGGVVSIFTVKLSVELLPAASV